MIIGIAGGSKRERNLLALVIQYHIYCDAMKKVYTTFTYSEDQFVFQVQQYPDYSFGEMERAGWELKSFSEKLKQCASIILNIPLFSFEDEDVLQSNLSQAWCRYFYTDYKGRKHRTELDNANPDFYDCTPMTVQKFLDEFASDACRDVVHNDFWINALMQEYVEDDKWIITDIKYINEADAIIKRGGKLIKIFDDSATELKDYVCDWDITPNLGLHHTIQMINDFLEIHNILNLTI